MNLNEFNDNFLDPLLQKLTKEDKKSFSWVILMSTY